MKFSAWYFILVGVIMFGQWGFFLAAGAVPEVQSEPIALAFHLTAEYVTAICLLGGGIALLRGASWAKYLAVFAGGLLAYTTIVSPGYFTQLGQFPMVGMFVVLLALDVISVLILIVKD